MKRFFGILNLLLCLELVVGPLAPQFSFLVSQESFAQESCPAGTSFNSTLNRCLTTEQTTTIMNSVSKCGAGDKACYKANAEEALKKAEADGDVEKELKNKGGLLGSGMKAAAIAVPLFMVGSMLFRGKNAPKQCSSIPLYMMLGGGAAVFIGDMWANRQHKKRLKGIRKEWEAKVQPKDVDTNNANNFISTTQNAASSEDQKAKATEAQSEAFEMLAKSEESLASAAKFKSGIYGIATLAFGASSVMSLMEHIKLTKLKAAIKLAPTPEAKAAATKVYVAAHEKAHCSNAVPKGVSAEDYANAKGLETVPVTVDQVPTNLDVTEDLKRLEAMPVPDMGGSSTAPTINPPDPRFESLIQGHNASVDLDSKILESQMMALANSNDLASLMTLHDSFEDSLKKRSSPSLDKYDEYVEMYKHTGLEESKEILEIAKAFSIKILNELNPIPSAHAIDPSKAIGGINNFLRAPLPRAGIAGVFAVWAGIMTMHARKQAKVSEERAEYLRSVKDTFNDATGAISCSSQERTNTANPRCYCYTPEGQRNSQRSSSAICMALFSGRTPPAATNYLNSATTNQKVCITSAGVDEKCACRSSNTCLSAIPNNFTGINPGSLSMLSSGLAPFGQVTNGQLAAASVNGASATANALKMIDAGRNMASKEPGLLASLDKAAKDGAAQLTAASAGMSAPSLGDNSSMPMNLNASQAADMLEKELKKADSEINSVSGGGTFSAPGGNAQENLEFGMTADQLAGDQTALAEVMDQKMDYGQNDINSKSDTNLFEVLSNRYQRSGMRRLFDEDGKVQADKPNKTDVNP